MVKGSFRYLFYVIGSAFFGLAVQLLAQLVVSFMTYHEITRNLLGAIAADLGAYLCLFILCRKKGYAENKNDDKKMDKRTVLNIVFAWISYIFLTFILQYHTGAATNVIVLARVMMNDPGKGINEMVQQHGGVVFLSLLLQTAPFVPAMIVGHLTGVRKRIAARKRLT